MKKIAFLLLLAAAVAGGWFLRALKQPAGDPPQASNSPRILRYQSPMHPWIKSDRPGKCTICGMDLVPVSEGQSDIAEDPDLVVLSPGSISVVDVQTSPVVRQPLHRTIELAGTLDDDDSRHRILSAYVEGRLDVLHINFNGAEVVEGQPMASLYSPTLLSAVREYLTLARSSQDPSGLAGAAAQRLLQYGLSASQIADLPSAFAATNLHVDLLAPMTGTVVARKVYEGQTVQRGQELFELADFSTMWFQAIAYENDIPWLKPGQTVEIRLPALPGQVFTNTIGFIDPNFDAMDRTTRVRIPVPNPWMESDGQRHRLFSHRLYGSARVQVVFPDVLTLPRSAVLDPGGRPLVFVEKASGAYEGRMVTLGRWGDSDIEVLDGLATGERVVTTGALLLDAQAQLSAAGRTTPVVPATNRPPHAALLTPPQKDAFQQWTDAASALSHALGTDDLEAFNAAVPAMHSRVAAVAEGVGSLPQWTGRITALSAASHLDPAPDLPAARREFNRFMAAAVPVGELLRSTDPGFASLKIYRCPMTRKSFPGAPARAEWLQLSGPLLNPYFGAEMPACGTEVAP